MSENSLSVNNKNNKSDTYMRTDFNKKNIAKKDNSILANITLPFFIHCGVIIGIPGPSINDVKTDLKELFSIFK